MVPVPLPAAAPAAQSRLAGTCLRPEGEIAAPGAS
jgi:hypothetical protein